MANTIMHKPFGSGALANSSILDGVSVMFF